MCSRALRCCLLCLLLLCSVVLFCCCVFVSILLPWFIVPLLVSVVAAVAFSLLLLLITDLLSQSCPYCSWYLSMISITYHSLSELVRLFPVLHDSEHIPAFSVALFPFLLLLLCHTDAATTNRALSHCRTHTLPLWFM